MQKRLLASGWTVMASLSVFVGLFSLRYLTVPFGSLIGVDAGIQRVIMHVPLSALTHMLIAPIALLAGPLQFLAAFRARHRQAHRIVGQIYVAACVIAGVGGLATAFHASGGPVAGLGFGILAVCWIGTTIGAWQAAVQRRIGLHQLLMRLSYAMTFAAVTLRLQIPIGFALGYPTYAAMSVWLAYTSWLPNVIFVGIYSLLLERPRRTRAAITAQA